MMDDTGVGETWRELDPADYARRRDAALRRADALRRDAGLQFWHRAWSWVRARHTANGLPSRREA
jgi:hypothetical protein